MATGTVVFQSNTLASPPANLAVMADAVNDSDHGAGTAQYVKIMDGATGGTVKASVSANGLAVDVTRVQGTVQALGTIQGHGTFQVLGTVQPHGTTQALGTLQPLAGSVHLANAITGTVQTHGTTQALGTVQPLAGSVHPAAALPGTSQISGTVRALAPAYVGENFFGTTFTAAVTNGTLVPAPGQGTFVRVYDILVSGSTAGTAFIEMNDGTTLATLFLAAQGGWSFNSNKGVRTRGTSQDVLFNCAAGSWGVMVNYALET